MKPVKLKTLKDEAQFKINLRSKVVYTLNRKSKPDNTLTFTSNKSKRTWEIPDHDMKVYPL